MRSQTAIKSKMRKRPPYQHFTHMYYAQNDTVPAPGGLGAHGSNPCTPTNKKARNHGLSSFLGQLVSRPPERLDQVFDQVRITGTAPNSTEQGITQAERVQLSTWANHSLAPVSHTGTRFLRLSKTGERLPACQGCIGGRSFFALKTWE